MLEFSLLVCMLMQLMWFLRLSKILRMGSIQFFHKFFSNLFKPNFKTFQKFFYLEKNKQHHRKGILHFSRDPFGGNELIVARDHQPCVWLKKIKDIKNYTTLTNSHQPGNSNKLLIFCLDMELIPNLLHAKQILLSQWESQGILQ